MYPRNMVGSGLSSSSTINVFCFAHRIEHYFIGLKACYVKTKLLFTN